MSAEANSVKSILYALVANFAIAAAKLGGAAYTGSAALLAEAVHSAADCGNQGLLLLGLRRAKRPATADYPLGHGKVIYFWSFIVALILFSMGGLFSIYEGAHKLSAPEPLTSAWLAISILVFAIVAESVSLYGALTEINKVRHGRNLWRWFRESRQSELIVILGEDVAALLGLVLALVAILLTVATGNPIFDAMGSIAIGVLLVLVAVGIGIETKGLLIGQSAEPAQREAIRAFVAEQPEIAHVKDIITLQLGREIMVAITAAMHEPEVPTMIAQIEQVKQRLRERFPAVLRVIFEPSA